MKLKLLYLLSIIIISTSLSISGQIYLNKEAYKLVNGCKIVFLDDKNKSIKFLQLREDIIRPADNKEEWLKTSLKFTQSHNLKVVSEENDKIGFSHTKFQIYYKNLPVEWAVYTVHSKKGRILSANGEYILGNNIDVIPSIKESDAFIKAINYVKAEKYKWTSENATRPVGELVILPIDSIYILAYKFDIYAIKPLSRQYIYINSSTGEILKTINRIENVDAVGTAKTMYSGIISLTSDYTGTNYRLRESGRGQGIETYNLNHGTNYGSATDFTDNDNNWNDTIDHNNAAYDAHYGTEATYDYYLKTFGRNSYDNLGSKLKSYVHYSYNYVNAFWDGACMTYGDGDGINYLPLTPIEVTAHEITHGVTEHSANLIYAGESGALNESFSDIFGIVIDFYIHPLTANYLMGDAMSLTHTPFRSMQDPNKYQCPDTYKGLYWDPYEEVHTNSGVQNFWFYLLSEGGTGTNDIGSIYSVNAIGREKAAAIAYRTLAVYLAPSSKYADARFYSILAANDLYGECSSEAAAVTNAWYAVGVGTQFNNAIIADFSSSMTSACMTPATVCFYNKSTKASTYLWDFGDGETDTSKNPVHSYILPGSYNVQLIASGSALCNTSDTLIQTNYITVANGLSPIAPSCIPHNINSGSGGIYQVTFNTINNITGGSTDNYKDYSCTDTSTVTEGREYPIGIKVGNTNKENIYVWLDLNNDGLFNNSDELILQKNSVSKQFSGTILIPPGAVYNTPLRLRIASDFATYHLDSACSNSHYGQIQDYAIQVKQNISAPEVDFTSSTQNLISGDTITFFDRSLNLPVSWNWSFPGGSPSASTEANPRVYYDTPGTYDVTLIAGNSHGTDTMYKIGYIKVTTPPPIGLTARIINPVTGEVKLKWYTLKDSVFFEDFEDGVANDFEFSDDCFTVDSGYLIAHKNGDDTWKSAYYNRDFQDFTFEYKFRREQGNINYSIGSFIRSDGFMNLTNANGYLINVTPSGYYGAWIMINGVYTNLIPWTTSSAVNIGIGAWNVVDIEAIGDNIKIYINGQYVNEFNNSTFTDGKVNVTSYLSSGSTHEVQWDYMKIYPGKLAININNVPKAKNISLTGENIINKAPESYVGYNNVEVKGLMPQGFGSSNVFKYYNLYRDSLLIDTTSVNFYRDTLPKYGKYDYMVTSMYEAGESTPTNHASVDWVKPEDGDFCANAQNLRDLASPYYGTTSNYTNEFSFCNMNAPDRVFYLDLQNTDSLIIGQIWSNYNSSYSLRLGGSCPGDTEIICLNGQDVQTHIYVNTSGSTQRIYWIQSGYSMSFGSFLLSWDVIHTSCPKPKKFTSDSITFHSAQISWLPGSAETRWDFEWGLGGFKHGEGTLEKNLTTNSYNLSGLVLGTKYDYYVRAICDSSDESWWVGPLSFYTKGLDQPVNLKALVKDPSAGEIELTWEPKALGFNDDFEDGLAQNWKPVTGNWQVANGVYEDYTSIQWPSTNTSYYDQDFTNFEYEAKMRSRSSYSNWIGLYFNGDPSSLNGSGEWMNGYWFIYSISGNWELVKTSSGVFTVLYYGSSPDIRQGINIWNNLKVIYADGNIECYINGVLQGVFFDNYFKKGKVGLFVYNYSFNAGNAEFDDVKLTPLQSGYVFGKVMQNPLRNIYKDMFNKNSSNLIGQEKAPMPLSQNPFVYKITDSAYYRVYRDDLLIDSTYATNYSDTLITYGIFKYKVSAVCSEGESKFSNPVNVTWYGTPLISVTPSSFDETLLSGDSVMQNMTIKNIGTGRLIFNIYSVSNIGNPDFRLIKPNKIVNNGDSLRSSTDITNPDVKSKPQIMKGTSDINVLIFRDNLAWGFNVNVPILESLGVNITIAGSYDMGTINLSHFKLIIFESQQPSSFYNSYVANLNRFNEYLNAGGTIEFHCATYSSNRIPNLPFPGGMRTLTDMDADVTNFIVEQNHPIVEGVVGPLVGNSASHEAFQNIPAGGIIITNNESGLPTTVEYKFGAGTLIATAMTWEWGYWNNKNFAKMLPNAFKYALTKKGEIWLNVSPETDTLDYGDSVNVNIKFNAKNLAADVYRDTMKIVSTDLDHPTTNVPCVLYVLGKPTANFSASATNILFEDSVHFTDLSVGSPTSWKWEFPGGIPSESTAQNPTVTYLSTGTYDVTLIAANSYGSDTVIKVGFINARDNLYCISNLGGQGYCPGDITNFSITGSTLNNAIHNSCSTANNSTYGSYPASGSTTATLVNGQYYTVNVTTSNYDIISIWIDYNHNQIFEASEWTQVSTYSTPSVPSTVNILVPANASSGTTGLRIRSNRYWYSNGANDACSYFSYGITEDYTITIDGSVIPDFTANVTSTCTNTNINFTNASVGSITSYQWDFGMNASPATASTAGPHLVKYSTSGAKTISLTVNGTVVKTKTDYININAKPGTPVITKSGNSLISNAPDGNQWYTTQSGIINGATSRTYAPQMNASYYVIVTLNGCSSDASSVYLYTGLDELSSSEQISVYPIPVSNILTIQSNMGELTVKLTGVTGEIIFNRAGINTSEFTIDMSKYSSGVYILNITSKNKPGEPIIRKILKK
jgi:Zn-dependent metalloprotease